MSNLKKIAVSTITRFSSQIVSMLVTFLLTPLMIKTLGDYNYGIWVLVTVIVSYYGYSELGISSALERNLAVASGDNNKKEFNIIFNNGLFLNFLIMIIVLIITFISFFVIKCISFKEHILVGKLVVIMGINLALTFPFKSLSTIVTSAIRHDLVCSVLLTQLILNSLITAYLLLNGYGLIAISLSMLFTTLPANCLYIVFVKFLLKSPVFLEIKHINRKTISNLLKFSGKTFLSQMAEILRCKLDEVVTGAFISVNMVTTYSIAGKLNMTANNLILSFLGVLTPFFANQVNIKNDEEKAELFFSASKISIMIASFVFFSFLFFGKPFIQIWLGEHYLKSYYPLIIIALAYYIAYIQSVSLNYMMSTNTHQYFAYISLIEGGINLVFSILYVTIFKMGIVGVALGTLTGMVVSKLFLQPYIMSGLLKIKLFSFYSFFISKVSIGFVLYVLTGLGLMFFSYNNYLKLFMAESVFLLIALAHLSLMLNSREKNFIKEKITGYINSKKHIKEQIL